MDQEKQPDTLKELLGQLPNSLTQAELASFLGVSDKTLYRWRKAGLVSPALRVGPPNPLEGGSKVFYSQTEIAKAILIKTEMEAKTPYADLRQELASPRFLSDNLSLVQGWLDARGKGR